MLPHHMKVPVYQCRLAQVYGVPLATAWDISVARFEPNRQPLDLYQSQTFVGSPPARSRRSARQYWSLQLPLVEYTTCNWPFGSLIGSGPSLMNGLPTTRSQL